MDLFSPYRRNNFSWATGRMSIFHILYWPTRLRFFFIFLFQLEFHNYIDSKIVFTTVWQWTKIFLQRFWNKIVRKKISMWKPRRWFASRSWNRSWLIRRKARVWVPGQTSKWNMISISSATSSQQISGKNSASKKFLKKSVVRSRL